MSETITLNAIVEESGSAVDEVFHLDGNPVVSDKSGDRLLPNQTIWNGPNAIEGKTVDRITVQRGYPKPNGVFYGVMRPTFKRTFTVNVDQSDGTTKATLVQLGVEGSIPVGLSTNDKIRLANQVIALLGLSTFQTPWMTGCKIENFT